MNIGSDAKLRVAAVEFNKGGVCREKGYVKNVISLSLSIFLRTHAHRRPLPLTSPFMPNKLKG